MTPTLARAREDLAAARILVRHDCPAQAVTTAADAAVRVAEEALRLLDRATGSWCRRATVTLFVRYVVRERGLDPAAGRLLRSLTNRARQVDHEEGPVPAPQAEAAVRDAATVVELVAAWVEHSVRVAAERGPRSGGRPRGARATQRRRPRADGR